jgi:hypothetical protein
MDKVNESVPHISLVNEIDWQVKEIVLALIIAVNLLEQ